MDLKNYTQVLIDGKVYTLGGSEDESYLQKAASYVNEKNSAMRKVPGFTKQSADYQMVMTELNIADDYFKAMERADEMERQKNNMEKETYSLKHELVSTQMKLEAVLKDLEERQRELDRYSRKTAELEGELKEAKESVQEYRDRAISEAKQSGVQSSISPQTDAEEVKRETAEASGLMKDTGEADTDSDSAEPLLNAEEETVPEEVGTSEQPTEAPGAGGQPKDAAAVQASAQPQPAVSAQTPAQPQPAVSAQASAQPQPAVSAQSPAQPQPAVSARIPAQPQSPAVIHPQPTAAVQSAATVVPDALSAPAGSMSDEELARKALQAAKKAGSHKGGRR